MEARMIPAALAAAALLACGAGARSQNFIVTAPTQELATEICQAAETFRRDLAIEWLGQELPPWHQPCPITAKVHPHLGAGGQTSFMFDSGMPFGWTMEVQGSRQRVLDSVLPHEVTHTIFATHFGRPLPRWADEGACTTVEHPDEKARQDRFLVQFLTTDRGIPFNKMFAMKEYPPDILPLYAQGYSLARYLIQQGGKQKYIQFVGEGMKTNNWPAMTKKYYGFRDLSDLQVTWLAWVAQGSPDLSLVAQNQPAGSRDEFSNDRGTPAQLVSVGNPASNAKVLGSQSMANEYSRPDRPSTLNGDSQAAKPVNASASRPYSEGWYSKKRDQSQIRTPAPGAANHMETPPPTQLPLNRGAQLEMKPNDGFVAAVAPSQGAVADAASNPRQVLLEWSRPSDKPWSNNSNAVALNNSVPGSSLGRH